jgi:hypothetical protein
MVTRRQASAGIAAAAAMVGSPVPGAPVLAAQEQKTRELPPPRMAGGKPLLEALKLRRSTRAYSDQALPPQMISDLLWSAFGINRAATGDRTAPYWRHVMVIDVYAAMADGVWLYEPSRHALVQYQNADIRGATGLQDFVATAPLNLVYVAALRLRRCRFHRPERISVLRLRGPRQRVSRRSRRAEAGADHALASRPVRHVRADGRLSAELKRT